MGFKSKTATAFQLDLDDNAKIALLVDQIRRKSAEMYIEEIKAEHLKSRMISGNPEYRNALLMSEAAIREGGKIVDCFKAKLADLQGKA